MGNGQFKIRINQENFMGNEMFLFLEGADVPALVEAYFSWYSSV